MKRNTLIILLIAVALGVFVYYYEIREGKPRDEVPDKSVPAFTFEPEDVTTVTLANADKAVTAERSNGKWTIIQPLVTEADQGGLDQTVDDFARLKLQDTKKGTPENLKEFGLSDSKTVAEFKLKNGETHRVKFGAKDFTGSSVYVQVDQMADAGLVATPMLLLAQKSLNDLRDRQILKLQESDLTRFRIKNPNLTLAAEKSSEGKWLAKEPANKKDKEVNESKALGSWLSTVAQEVIDSPSPETRAKAAKTAVEAQLTAKDGQTTSLKVSEADDDNAYVTVEGRDKIYRIRKSELESMSFKLADVIAEPTPTPTPEASPAPSTSASPSPAKKAKK